MQLYGDSNSPTTECAASSPPAIEPELCPTTNSSPTVTQTDTLTTTQTDTQTDTEKSEEMVVDMENKAQAVEVVSTEDVKITSNLEARMSDKPNKEEFNAMFHGQEVEEDEDMDSMQVYHLYINIFINIFKNIIEFEYL